MKIFTISDTHSFYTAMKSALDDAGFQEGNPEHLLVVCGDIFDRGYESQQMLDYMMQVSNKVLIRGNHESLLEDFCKRGHPMYHDWHNGTSTTIMDLAPESKNWDSACPIAMEKVKPLLKQMVDYYETEHYVFVHSFIPLVENWREAHYREWEDARWGNPFEEAIFGNMQEGKTLVFGHYHTSWMWSRDGVGNEWGEDACFDPYYGDGFIGIDACTAYSGKVNVLVIEDNLLEESNG